MKSRFFVGSLPCLSVEEAIAYVQKESSHLPFLPQLPELNPQEDMIGQVLRGFDLGFWDEQASSALELFQNTFCESPRFKIQIAGPFTVSRTLSVSLEEIIPQWMSLVFGIYKQLRQAGFVGELWLQMDEPLLPALPKGMALLLAEFQTQMPKMVWGLHSCATQRPTLSPEDRTSLRFVSFDCSRTPVESEERSQWELWLQENPKRVLAWGHPWGEPLQDSWALQNQQVWSSAPCGLYGQSLY